MQPLPLQTLDTLSIPIAPVLAGAVLLLVLFQAFRTRPILKWLPVGFLMIAVVGVVGYYVLVSVQGDLERVRVQAKSDRFQRFIDPLLGEESSPRSATDKDSQVNTWNYTSFPAHNYLRRAPTKEEVLSSGGPADADSGTVCKWDLVSEGLAFAATAEFDEQGKLKSISLEQPHHIDARPNPDRARIWTVR